MGRMNEKQVTLVTAAAMTLIAIGLGVAAYFYFYDNDQKAQADRDKYKKERDGLQKKKTELDRWNRDLPLLQKDDKDRVDILPTREEIREGLFHEQVYELARESNVKMRASAPAQRGALGRPGVGKPPYDRISYKYTVEGEFYHVAAFLSRIEGMKRFVKVASVKVTPLVKDIETRNNEKISRMYTTCVLDVDFFFLP